MKILPPPPKCSECDHEELYHDKIWRCAVVGCRCRRFKN